MQRKNSYGNYIPITVVIETDMLVTQCFTQKGVCRKTKQNNRKPWFGGLREFYNFYAQKETHNRGFQDICIPNIHFIGIIIPTVTKIMISMKCFFIIKPDFSPYDYDRLFLSPSIDRKLFTNISFYLNKSVYAFETIYL